MSTTAPEAPRIVRAVPGRLRVHLPGWDLRDSGAIQAALIGLEGVIRASVRPSTGNALVEFDEETTDARALLEAVALLASRGRTRRRAARARPRGQAAAPEQEGPPGGADSTAAEPPPPAEAQSDDPTSRQPLPLRAPDAAWTAAGHIHGVLRERAGRFGRARIAVRGIDRDPHLARRVVEALERRPDVRRAQASATTGRVLVEFSDRVASLQEIVAEVSKLELPGLPGEDRPAHPLDPAPVLQNGARAIGAAAGLALVALQRALGGQITLPGRQTAGAVAGALGIVEGTPPVRAGLAQVIGRERSHLLFGGAAIASLTFSGSTLGLLVSGAGALRLYTEARARSSAFEEYEQRLADAAEAQPGAVVRLEAGSRVPLHARVIEGVGTVLGCDGLPDGVTPGSEIDGGARVLCGPLIAELIADQGWSPQPRPRPPRQDWLGRYMMAVAPASVAYAVVHAVRNHSPAALLTGLLLVNPRAALIGTEAADTGASARVLRAGVTVVGTRVERQVRRPDAMIIDGPRVLTRGLEQTRIIPAGGRDRGELSEMVAAMIAASEAPWGAGLASAQRYQATEADYDGDGVNATVAGKRLRLEPPHREDERAAGVQRAIEAGEQPLVLRDRDSGESIAFVHLRPRLAVGVEDLVRRCELQGVEVLLLEQGDRRASRMVARRAGVELVVEADLLDLVRERQRRGDRVAVLSDSPSAAEAFEACELAIGLSSGRSSHFQARADVLAPGLPAVAAIISAGARRDQASDLSVAFSAAANISGAIWGLQGDPGVLRASYATYAAALAAMAAAWVRLRGGRRSRSVISRLSDPRPERWGRMSIDEVLRALDSDGDGLSSELADARFKGPARQRHRNAFVTAMVDQLESPLVGVLGVGAALSLAMGAMADAAIIGSVIVASAAVAAWQEREAGRAARALEQIGAARARVVRDGEIRELRAGEVVPGDVLLLGAGDRLVADARLLESDALEVDEAALTGESLPVSKAPDADRAEERIVLEGSDVTVGSAKAVVVAVGRGTRLGATAAALAVEQTSESPLGERLNALFRQAMPLILGGGALVTLAGMAWGGQPLTQLAIGASVAIAAVPEGLPLLAGVAEAAVARRLATRNALVRRLSAVEALGRVDVVCSDKTGTLTYGRLAVTVVDDLRQEADASRQLPHGACEVLLAAAYASPEPDDPDALAHATDAAVLNAARDAGLVDALSAPRDSEAPFDPVRSLHATELRDRVCVKGATEVLAPRCTHVRGGDGERLPLDEDGRGELERRAERLASRGLRVLMVAEGPKEADVEDPQRLTALGFVGISDPVREGAAEAVARCHAAGIRVIMLTGDHQATARAIAHQAGLPLHNGAVMTGDELEELDDSALARRLDEVSVIARITPVDKVRIVESLQRSGGTVAMTGDGVNDAPALRLADVGVAMGAGGTEVARQAADLVLADDRFGTLTDALLEGRSLWHNMHGALGLLLGGNLGEIGLMAGAAMLGRGAVLRTRQILVVNLLTDVLPAVAVAVQPPREAELRLIERRGDDAFDSELVSDVLRRGTATAAPALAAVLAASALGAPAAVVGFSSIIVTQLAQTLQMGRAQDHLSPSVAAALAGSMALLGVTVGLAPIRAFLGLPAPTPISLALVAATAPAAIGIAKGLEA